MIMYIMSVDHKLSSSWSLYYHDLNNIDWTISGYNKLIEIDTIEDYRIVLNSIKDWNDGLYYLMRNPHLPIWEDDLNKNGGGWTFKIIKSNVQKFWADITAYSIGETISSDPSNIVGISISPKAKFATIRVWSKNNNADISHFIVDKNRGIDFKDTRHNLNI